MCRLIARSSLVLVLSAASAVAQTAAAPTPDKTALGSTLGANVLGDLPLAGSVFSVLETMQAEAVADRFNSGGLNGGAASHLVALLGSQRQSRYRIGDVDISSAKGGTPMLFPDLAFWQRVDVTTASMPIDVNANGLAIALEPRRAATRWSGFAEGFVSNTRLVTTTDATRPPPITRLDQWTRGAAIASGPLGRRSGLVVGTTVTDARTLVRDQRARAREYARSLFTHFIFAPANDRETRSLAWMQFGRGFSAIHVQSTIERIRTTSFGWRVAGGYTQHAREERRPPAIRIVDRLIDGPVPSLMRSPEATDRRWSVAARVTALRRRHAAIGVEYAGTTTRDGPMADAIIGETLDGIPARVWRYTSPGVESHRRASSIAAFASDRLELSPSITLDAGLRVEGVRGTARGATAGITWYTLLPTAGLRWRIGARLFSTFFTNYRRSANQLTLDLLEHGDPAAPVGHVFRWDDAIDGSRSLVALVGPGTGGNPAFSAISQELKRPHTDELVIGVEARPSPTWRLQVAGIASRQASLINVVNVGVPLSGYRPFTVPDGNADLVGSADDQLLPVYERRPDTFGHDRYLLTNPPQDAATMGAVVITAQAETRRLFVLIGATAAAVVGPGSSRGYRVDENDQDDLGEIFSNPNASTHARGRLFSDRAYTIKWTTVYRFPLDLRLGLIARYQDGQPFSRLVIVPSLAQGPEAIQAFANGRSRFAFTGTLDMRLQRGLSLKRTRLDAVLDVYNLLNMKKEVEEYVVTGPRFRETTAIQPPRTVHVGFRVGF